jgi:DNA processing protein
MIENGGCAITEMPLGWKPRAQDFPRRNRIVAGMSLGTVVVEANPRSGSLITARLANELGRIVFAVPGSPLDPRAKGANKLLSEGATIVTEANDIISLLAPLVDNVSDEKAGGELFEADPNESPLLQSLIGEEAALDLQASPPNNQEIATDARDAPISAREKVLTLLSASPTEIDEIIRQCSLTQSALKATLVDLELEGLIEQKGGFVTRLC